MAEGHLASSAFKKDYCVICKLGFENAKPVYVTKKGISTLIDYSEKRGRDDLHTYLNQCISADPIESVLVHPNCRRDFTDEKRLGLHGHILDGEVPCAKRLRSSFLSFNWKEDCMLCIKSAIFQWASEVENRLKGCIDLVAAEAVYHDSCLMKFMLKRDHKKKKTAGQ